MSKGGGFSISYQARREARTTIHPLPETRPPFWVYVIFILFIIGICACIVGSASLAR